MITSYKTTSEKLSFSSKARTLTELYPILKTARILPQICFTVQQWKDHQKKIIETIKNFFLIHKCLIARSSALLEDGLDQSLAGHYQSVQNITNETQLIQAIPIIINSYNNSSDENEIFIQPMLQNVLISGVIFSKDPNTGGNYYVINYDDVSGLTNTVSSGKTNTLKTFYCYKFTTKYLSHKLNCVIQMIQELEKIFNHDALDAEFAIDKNKVLYLLQVRPLIITQEKSINQNIEQVVLKNISQKINEMNKPHPYLFGQKTVFGIMPDWNPAEIIGVKPKPLALSLYKELITDNIWAYQRDNYGYKNLRSFPLLIDFFGLPYIDVRVSFNSFIPKDISAELSEKLVNYYISRLVQTPSHHDKVEFEIIFSCYTLDIFSRLEILKKFNFTEDDLQQLTENLRHLTNKIIHAENGLWRQDIEKINLLEKKYKTICESHLDIISKIYWLIEDCKRYGTLPFAGLARAGFIAMQLLKSLVYTNVIDQIEYESFLNDLETINVEMTKDFSKLSKKDFLGKYGHLRPGTYDILASRYDEQPEKYFNWDNTKNHDQQHKPFALSMEQLKQTEQLLKKHGLEHNVVSFFEFIKSAIKGREYAKFIFSRSLSEILRLFKILGKQYGFNTDDCSYANIECIKNLYSSSKDITLFLGQAINQGKQQYKISQSIILPSLITSSEDVWLFDLPIAEPNFITLKSIGGPIIFPKDLESQKGAGGILVISHADPGYDWIFSHNIAGFITMYGGVNSHMAIRANELNLPAVIGVGEILYNKLINAKIVQIDCANKLITVLQ